MAPISTSPKSSCILRINEEFDCKKNKNETFQIHNFSSQINGPRFEVTSQNSDAVVVLRLLLFKVNNCFGFIHRTEVNVFISLALLRTKNTYSAMH